MFSLPDLMPCLVFIAVPVIICSTFKIKISFANTHQKKHLKIKLESKSKKQ